MRALTEAQAKALHLVQPWLPADCYLAGGVTAAHLAQHRQSRDLDFFTTSSDPLLIVPQLEAASGDIRVMERAKGTLYLEVGGVPVSVIRYRYPLLAEPKFDAALGVKLASEDDLLCMKMSAIASRGLRRDFWDVQVLLERQGRSLRDALRLYKKKYEREDVGHVVRALVFFDDAEAEPSLPGLDETHWQTLKQSFREQVRDLHVNDLRDTY